VGRQFRFEETGGDTAQSSWLLTWLRRTERTQQIVAWFGDQLGVHAVFRLSHDGTSIRARKDQRRWCRSACGMR
jgi:NitT/TauT family transport system permease protein